MFGETTISHVKILNHPIETTIKNWFFRVPGNSLDISSNQFSEDVCVDLCCKLTQMTQTSLPKIRNGSSTMGILPKKKQSCCEHVRATLNPPTPIQLLDKETCHFPMFYQPAGPFFRVNTTPISMGFGWSTRIPYQVIQAVTFWSPIVGGHQQRPWKGHLTSPSQKGHDRRIAR